MAGNSTISITYKLEGDNGGFKKLTVDAEGLRKVLGGTVNQAEKLKGFHHQFCGAVCRSGLNKPKPEHAAGQI